MDDGIIEYLKTLFIIGGIAISFFLVIGLVPAILIGGLTGRVTAYLFLRRHGWASTVLRSIMLGAIIGLVIALPLISIWPAFLIALFGGEKVNLEISKFILPVFAPFCIVTGMFIGKWLHDYNEKLKEHL